MQKSPSKLAHETAFLSEASGLLDFLEKPGNWPHRPPVDEKSTKATAFAPNPGGRDSALKIDRNHHRQLFRRAFGALESKLHSYLDLLEAYYKGLGLRFAKVQAEAEDIPEEIEALADGLPWGIWDRCKVALILLFSFAFIGVDLNSVATTLQESGVESFQSPLRAWCFSAVPLAVAVCLKLLRDCMDDRGRRIHACAVTSLGIVSGFIWLYFFSSTFPSIARSPIEIVSSFSLDTLPGSQGSNNWLVFFGLTAAIAAAAASWTAVESMVEAHRIKKRIDNLDYQAKQSELAECARLSDLYKAAIDRTRSSIERIEMEREDFLAEAQNVFDEADAGVAYSRDALIKFKNLALFLIGAFLLVHLSTPSIAATQQATSARKHVIVVASPYLTKQDREACYRETVRLVLDGLSPGDILTVLDGVRLDVPAQTTIPEGEVFRKNANARARACARELAALRQFFAAEVAHAPKMEGVVHVPQVLALSATHLRKPKQPTIVLILGSQFYVDADGAFDMLGGYVPSDEHLRVTSRQSVYGTADKAVALEGVTVHYAYLHEAFEHADHRQAVGRLWSLFVQCQGGTLSSFAASLTVVFRRVTEGAQEPVLDVKLDENDRHFVMRRWKHIPAPTSGTQTNRLTSESAIIPQTRIVLSSSRASDLTSLAQSTNQLEPATASQSRPLANSVSQTNSVPANPPDASTLPRIRVPVSLPSNAAVVIPTNSEIVTRVIPESLQAGKQGIAIVWSVGGKSHQGVDVDLRVRPPKSDVELSFLNKETLVGRHLRDVLNADGDSAFTHNPQSGFEYVELDADVPLRDTAVWLNLFRNDSKQAVEGTVLVATKERLLQGSFRFPAALCGDAATQANQRDENPNWLRFDLNALLNRR
jgi:hypothetical protein